MNKQTYQKPNIEIIGIEAEQMIATSGPAVGVSTDKVDTDEAALGRERRGSFGNLWVND
jgi:hypothetical protein